MAPGYLPQARRILFAASILAAAALPLSGCRSIWLADVEAKKGPSLAAWDGATINGQPARDYVAARSAVITSGWADVVAEVGKERSRIVIATGAEGGGCGAVAIAPDGYFLTAGHCVREAPFMIYALQAGRHMATQARVITWIDSDDIYGPDFALVHAPLSTPCYAPPAVTVKAGEPVLCAGSGIGSSIFAGGSVTGEDRCRAREITVRIVIHDAPLYLGDSGGPVFDADGGLIGISVWSEFGPARSPHASAQLPDPAELQRLIERDRADHPRLR